MLEVMGRSERSTDGDETWRACAALALEVVGLGATERAARLARTELGAAQRARVEELVGHALGTDEVPDESAPGRAPLAPRPEECCGTACDPCIWTYYHRACDRWIERAVAWVRST